MPERERLSGSRPIETDGRRRRSQRSRERILHALAEALSDPDIELTPEQVAARSGYSISTIFRHFGDQEGLSRAMRELVLARVQTHLSEGPFEGDLDTRLRELVRRSTAIFEIVVPLARTMARSRYAIAEERHRDQDRELEDAIGGLIGAALAPELRGRTDATEEIVASLVTQGTWAHMRRVRGHSPERARELLEAALLRVLGSARPGG